MKKYLMLAAMATLFILTGCDKNKKDEYKTRTVTVQLTYPEGSNYSAIEGIVVMASSADNTTPLESKTDAAGIASFELPAGVWSFSSSDRRSESGTVYLFNGVAGNVVVEAADTPLPVVIEFTQSKTSQVIIKELYVGGCPKDEGTGAFALDKYAILYNNPEYPARLSGVCLAMVYPFPSSNKTNYDYVNGVLKAPNTAGPGMTMFKIIGALVAALGVLSLGGYVFYTKRSTKRKAVKHDAK